MIYCLLCQENLVGCNLCKFGQSLKSMLLSEVTAVTGIQFLLWILLQILISLWFEGFLSYTGSPVTSVYCPSSLKVCITINKEDSTAQTQLPLHTGEKDRMCGLRSQSALEVQY